MTVVAALAAPFDRDVDAALARVEHYAARAREAGAKLLVLPESALGGYVREPGPEEMAPDVPHGLAPDGPELARLIALAGDLVICAGYSELAPEGLYASAICVSGDGVLGHQRKVHLPPAERFAYVPGDRFAAFDTPAGRLGMLLCYDKLFPEAARALALDGAEIVCSLSAWPVDRQHPARRIREDRQTRHFDLCDSARAVENQVFVVSVEPDRALGAAALPRLGQGRRPRGCRARAHRRARGAGARRGRSRGGRRRPHGHRPSGGPAARGVPAAGRRGERARLRPLSDRVRFRNHVRHRR